MHRIVIILAAALTLSGCAAVDAFLAGPSYLDGADTSYCYVDRGYQTYDGSQTDYRISCW